MTSTRVYPKVSGLSLYQNSCLPLLLVVVAPCKVILFWVYVTGPAFLPFLLALLELAFWTTCRMVSDDSWLLLTSSKQCFHGCNLIFGKKKKSGGQIQQVRTLGEHHHVSSSQNYCCFCLSVSSQGTNFTKIHHVFKSSLRIHWYFQSERSNWLMISEMVLSRSFLRLCEVSSHLPLCDLWRGTGVLTVLNQIFPMNESRNLLKCLCYFHGIVTNSCFEYLCIADAIVPSLKQHITQMHCSFIRK